MLLLYKAQLMPNSRQLEMLDTLQQVLQLSLQRGDLATYYDAASVLIYIYMCGNNMKELVRMSNGLEEKRVNVPEKLENTLTILDMVRSIGQDRFTDAEAQSEGMLFTQLPEDSQWLYLILSCIIYCCLGKLDHATHCMEVALELNKFKNIEPSTGFILMFLSLSQLLKNEKASLSAHTAKVISIGEKYEYEYLTAHGYRLTAYEKYLSFDRGAADAMLSQSTFHFLCINNKAMVAACKLLQSLWSIQPDGPAPDIEAGMKEIDLIREHWPGLLIFEAAQSILGAIAREAGDFSFAEHCLLSSIESAKEKKGQQTLCGAYFHLARLYFSAGDAEQGHCSLRQALELAAGGRYFMFWDIHIPTLTEMALRGIRYGYSAAYAEELLLRFYNTNTAKYLSEKIKTMDENRIQSFVDEFVYAYNRDHQGPTYFVQASLFGNPEISVNGIRIPETEWKTKKVKAFMEYLLLRSGSVVSKEVLAEILWPDTDSKSSTASQRTALYHLRKTLSGYQVETAGANAFIQETPEGLIIRKNSSLELDLHEFLHLYEEWAGMVKHESQDENKLAEILKRMVQIYKGDLLEGNDFGDQLLHERERLRSIFLEACQRLSSFFISNGEFSQAEDILRRAFALEPYDENLCLELLKLYRMQGRKSKAVKLYYSFKERLEQELGIMVDKRLTDMIRMPQIQE